MSRSVYDPDEIRALLARAANLQATERTPDGEGLTIDELKEVARESGIDPRYIELASTEGQLRTKTHWGMPSRVSRERWVEGALDEKTWKTMTKRFTRQFGVGKGSFNTDEGTWESGGIRIVAQQQGSEIHLQAETGWEADFEMPMALAIVSAIAALTTTGLAIVSLEWTIGLVAALFCSAVVLSVARFRKNRFDQSHTESNRLDESLMSAAMLFVGAHKERPAEAASAPLEIPTDDHAATDATSSSSRVRDIP